MTTIIVTGSRDWVDAAIIEKVVAALIQEFGTDIHIIHGAAKGADKHFAWYSKKLGIPVDNIHAYPADWKRYGIAAGPIRNQEMIDAHPNAELLCAFPLLTSKGTYDMIDKARRHGIPEIRIYNATGGCLISKIL